MSYNCLDRHIESGHGDTNGLIWESDYLNAKKNFTYKKLLTEVSKMCKIMLDNGVKRGDTVVIYMPMIPEAVFAILACNN